MQELILMVIDEGQQYGTDREIAVISLLQQQPLIIWTGDANSFPGFEGSERGRVVSPPCHLSLCFIP